MNKNVFRVVIILIFGLIILGGIFVYRSPTKEINHYISQFPFNRSNHILYPDNISGFLAFDEQEGLPAPSVRLNVLKRSLNTMEVLAGFEVMVYNSENVLKEVYSGELLFFWFVTD
ncbi:hypothetical protein NSQ91_03575 [Paenibacillus sp. FSL R7-0048]|jgi:hypothetical protein|uniref:hypothetical protein n=1 Tax=Paenibacillus sp. FSL R7-0048 TaxID=2954528 RepID=UPI0030F5E688